MKGQAVKEATKEQQYGACLDVRDEKGVASLGVMTNFVWQTDPKRLLFVLARYKFAARMLAGKTNVLEIGCADAFGSRIVRQFVKSLTVSDFDPVFTKDVQERMSPDWPMQVRLHDMLSGPIDGAFDAAYSLDVMEHIAEKDEHRFLKNIVDSLTDDGVLLIGMPSLQSQQYASPGSLAGHVNCKTGEGLKQSVDPFFANVFIFSMNDEVVHTGFYPMAHYLFALCCNRRRSASRNGVNGKHTS
ncbi:MAG: class I SAM-dependent methyltransferase [Gemmataceae bacterium]|nr:class I SAM-dependent methyltransferase [Gemmataceae bacterium]